jgi:hypothetical protein
MANPVAHCFGCHTVCHTVPRPDGGSFDRRFLYAGGRDLPDYGDLSSGWSAETSRPTWTTASANGGNAEIKRAITQGIRPDGTRLAHTMPYD